MKPNYQESSTVSTAKTAKSYKEIQTFWVLQNYYDGIKIQIPIQISMIEIFCKISFMILDPTISKRDL